MAEGSKSIRPTPEEVAEAARIIKESYDPATGRHPLEIFHAINNTSVRPVAELAVFSVTKQEVLLTKRDPDDLYYPDTWHLPGVIVVPPDIKGAYADPHANAAVRALEELANTRVMSLIPLALGGLEQDPRISRRGGEIAKVYGGILIDEVPGTGEMFDIHDLPEPIHEHHPQLVASAHDAMVVAPANLPLI